MDRKYIDCREFPEAKCSVALSADTDEELLAAALEHGIKTHGFQDTAETRDHIRQAFKSGHPLT